MASEGGGKNPMKECRADNEAPTVEAGDIVGEDTGRVKQCQVDSGEEGSGDQASLVDGVTKVSPVAVEKEEAVSERKKKKKKKAVVLVKEGIDDKCEKLNGDMIQNADQTSMAKKKLKKKRKEKVLLQEDVGLAVDCEQNGTASHRPKKRKRKGDDIEDDGAGAGKRVKFSEKEDENEVCKKARTKKSKKKHRLVES